MSTLTTDKLTSLIQKSIEKSGWIAIPSEGDSMVPLIQNGNLCRFEKVEPSILKKGDIVLYQSQTGPLVAHRFYLTKEEDGEILYIFKGDANLGTDEPVEAQRIIGRLVTIQKSEQFKLKANNPLLLLWGRLVMNYPAMSGFMRSYLNRKKQS